MAGKAGKVFYAIIALLSLAVASEFSPQRRLEELPRVEKKKPSYGQEFLQEIIKVFLHEDNQGIGNKYRANVRAMDLTMLLLGTYSKAWRSDGSAKEYAKNLQEEALKELKKGRIRKEGDGELLEGKTQEHSNSLGILYSASVSYGHIASPDAIQSTNIDATRRPQYGFRLSQQALRNAVIKEHMERLLELKQEIAFLRSQVELYCKTHQSDDAIYLWGVRPSDFNPNGMPSRTAVFCVPCEGNQLSLEIQLAIRQGLAYLSQQNSAIGHRLCLLYMGQLTQTKALAQEIELRIADLAVQYAKLNNMEKEKER